MHTPSGKKAAVATTCISLMLLITACGVIAPTTSAPSATATTTPFTATEVPAATPQPVEELILWVAPAFAPDETTPAGQILNERLERFLDDHPNVELSVRIKSLDGDSGLLSTLLSASIAAPESVPDVITLDQNGLIAAAGENLLQPVEAWSTPPDAEEWYDFAISGSRLNGTVLGMPLVGEASVFAFRSARFERVASNWDTLLEENERFCLPLGDPTGSLTYATYRQVGGAVVNEESTFILETGPLSDVLSFYQRAQEAQLLDAEATTSLSASECWDLLSIDQVSAGVVPLQNVLRQIGSSLSAVPIPSQNSPGFSLVTTWSLALTGARPERQELAVELAEWLSDPIFVGAWSEALGYLPARAEALSTWTDEQQLALASSLVTLTTVEPSAAMLAPFSAAITTAIEDVLDRGIAPPTAAAAASEGVAN